VRTGWYREARVKGWAAHVVRRLVASASMGGERQWTVPAPESQARINGQPPSRGGRKASSLGVVCSSL
jgi:hypothetical protein